MKPAAAARTLSQAVSALRFRAPVTHVYNPLEYAWEAHAQYLERYARPGIEALFLGMNPGPWGMAQTGVPFGEVRVVRDWLGIEAPIGQPAAEHPKRPILGFACRRSEVSGARIWGWAEQAFATPNRFFDRFFVANYCPLVFMEESGKNFTPDRLPKDEREPLFRVCDAALRETVRALSPRFVVGVGLFAEGRARAALDGMAVAIGRIPHPSPANPAANRGWTEAATAELARIGIELAPV